MLTDYFWVLLRSIIELLCFVTYHAVARELAGGAVIILRGKSQWPPAGRRTWWD